MMQSGVSGGQIFQCMEPVTVHNYPPPREEASPLAWISASLSMVAESAHVYDRSLDLVYHNNRYGTLSAAPPHALANLHTVFEYLRRFYCNTDLAVANIIKTLNTVQPRSFRLFLVKNPNTILECRSAPVVSGRKVLGVVVLASRCLSDRATIRCERGDCAQPRPCCSNGIIF